MANLVRTRSAPSLALSFLFTGAGFALPFLVYPAALSAELGRAPEVLNLYCLVAWMGLSHFVFAYKGHAAGAAKLRIVPQYLLILLASIAALFALRFFIEPSLFHSLAWIYFIAHLLKSELYFAGQRDWRLFLFPLASFAFFSWAMYAPDHWANQTHLFLGAALCFSALALRPKAGLFHRFSQPIFLVSTFLIGEALIWGTYRPNMTPQFRDGVYTVHVALASFYHYFKSYTHMLGRKQGSFGLIVAVNLAVILLGSIAQFRLASTPVIFLLGVQYFTVWVWLHQWMSDVFNWLKRISPALLLLLPAQAFADEDCWNFDRSFYNCDAGGGAAGGVGASAPLVGDTLGSNPAAMPVEPTPFGIEAILSDRAYPRGRPKVDLSTVKGFEGVGIGIGSWIDGTFTAPDFPSHFLGSSARQEFLAFERDPPAVLALRIGATVLLPQGPFPKGVRFSLGASAGLGRISGELAPQVGVLARFFGLGLGYSESFEQLTRLLPKTRITSLSVGLPLRILYLGYTYSVINSAVNRSFSNTISARLRLGSWVLHGGLKSQKDHRHAPDTWARAGLQRRLGKRIGAGYEYGYYRLSHSLALQVYF